MKLEIVRFKIIAASIPTKEKLLQHVAVATLSDNSVQVVPIVTHQHDFSSPITSHKDKIGWLQIWVDWDGTVGAEMGVASSSTGPTDATRPAKT